MRPILALLLFNIHISTIAQMQTTTNRLKADGTIWNYGTLHFSDQTILEGDIQYNTKNGVLSIKTINGSESYTANSVSSFFFFDKELNLKRSFVSLDYPIENLTKGIVSPYFFSENDKNIRPTFFEVIKETKKFAVLSKIKPIEYKEKTKGVAAVGGNVGGFLEIKSDEIKQDEIIFFLNDEGLQPYVEFKNKEVTNIFHEDGKKSIKTKRINSDLLAEMTGVFYSELMDYTKSNGLQPSRKDDLMKIFDHFILLENQ